MVSRTDSPAGDRLVVPIQRAGRARDHELERVYRAHYRDVYRYVLALTRSADEAQEVSADAFERALRSWEEVPEPALPWLLLTARRITTDRWRRSRRWAKRALATGRRTWGDAGEEQTEFWLWFDALSAALTARQREVLLLRYQRDLTDTDIAGIMGVTESGVRSLVARALEELRAHPELL